MIIQIESLDQGISLGRIDQYLYPLYQAELQTGTFNPDTFRDLFGAFCLKLSEIIPLFSERVTAMFGGLPTGQALTLGGCHQDGSDAANPLTFLMLDVLEALKTRQPNWHARISPHSSSAYLQRVYQLIAQGGGSPAVYNDAVILPALKKQQFPPEQIYNYATVGCVEPALPGISFTSSDAALFNAAMAMELVLGEGKRLRGRLPGRKRSPHSIQLNRIQSFAEFKTAVFDELQAQLAILKRTLDQIEIANARFHPTPFASLTVQGCLDKAIDLARGGALINASGIQAVGIADLANSLAAIEEMVFRQQRYSLTEVARACARNFKGTQHMRAHLQKAAKFGNDQARVDELAAEVISEFEKQVSQYRNTRGGRWMAGGYSMTCHRAFGSHMAALPSGRLAGESLADGIAPADGSDRLGPTASLNSCVRLDHTKLANGVNLNMKIDADTLHTKGGAAILGALLGGYFDQGGMQVQVNVLDHKVLEDAVKHPERHRNLLVRISGYCAYFVDLSPAMQQELLDRSLQKL